MRKLCRLILFLAVAVGLSGCLFLAEEHYKLVRTSKHIDPGTGDTVVTSVWRYDDGYETTTKDVYPPTAANEQRRNAHNPPGRLTVTIP